MTTPPAAMALDTNTRLAVERTRMAHERTLMAWVRTGTSLISFGFTIYKFFHEFRIASQAARVDTLFGAREFALVMITVGVVSLLIATLQHVNVIRKMRAQYGDIPYSLASLLGILISLLGLLALLVVIFRQ